MALRTMAEVTEVEVEASAVWNPALPRAVEVVGTARRADVLRAAEEVAAADWAERMRSQRGMSRRPRSSARAN